MNGVRTLGTFFALGVVWSALVQPIPAVAGEYDQVLSAIAGQLGNQSTYLSDIDNHLGAMGTELQNQGQVIGLMAQDVLDIYNMLYWWSDIGGPLYNMENSLNNIETYLQGDIVQILRSFSRGYLSGFDGSITFPQLMQGMAVTQSAVSNILSKTLQEGTNNVIKALLSINNKLDNMRGGVDMSIVTNFLIADSYRPITDPIGGWYDDYSQFLEMLSNPDYIDTYMYYYGPWRYHVLNYLSYLPVGSAGGQSMDSLYLRPGEASYINELYLNTETGHDSRYSWAYYDLYGTGEVLRHMTNNLGFSQNAPIYGVSTSNTVEFTEATRKSIAETRESTKSTILGTNHIDVASDVISVETNRPGDVDTLLDHLTGGDGGTGGGNLDNSLQNLTSDLNTQISSVESQFGGASSDCRIDANFEISFSDEAQFSSDGQWYIDLGTEVDKISEKGHFSFIVTFFVWAFKAFFVLEYAFKAFRRVMESV